MERTRVARVERTELAKREVTDPADEEDDPAPRATKEPEHEKEEARSPAAARRPLAASVDDVGALVRVVPAHGGKYGGKNARTESGGGVPGGRGQQRES